MDAQDIDTEIAQVPSTSLRPNSPTQPGSIAIVNDEITEKPGRTQRGLSDRHVQLMAIAGSIGTGLFVGIGASLGKARRLGVLLAYIIYPTLLIWPGTMCVAEMTTHLPVRGNIHEFAMRFVNPAFGFALVWTSFYASSMLYCAEINAMATVMGYWDVPVDSAVWAAMTILVCLGLNVFAVKVGAWFKYGVDGTLICCK